MQVPEHLRNYIDYEAYGRDIALEESGQFTDLGYVRDTGDSFHEYYDGERGSIPEEYRVMTFQDDIPEEEISEWAMDLAYDMDEFFRQNDPQYAAEHPEEHAAKEEIYENLMAGRISALDEKLAALGQTQEDYLPSEIEKFKDATGYEEFLDVDPQAIREAIENPDQSHVDEMLSFAEQANREYEAELYGQQAAPTPDDRETGETVPDSQGHLPCDGYEPGTDGGGRIRFPPRVRGRKVSHHGQRQPRLCHPQRRRTRTYRAGEVDCPGGGAHEGTLCEGNRPRPPCAASGGGRRHCRLLSL